MLRIPKVRKFEKTDGSLSWPCLKMCGASEEKTARLWMTWHVGGGDHLKSHSHTWLAGEAVVLNTHTCLLCALLGLLIVRWPGCKNRYSKGRGQRCIIFYGLTLEVTQGNFCHSYRPSHTKREGKRILPFSRHVPNHTIRAHGMGEVAVGILKNIICYTLHKNEGNTLWHHCKY